VRLEGFGQLKNPMTLSVIEPATFSGKQGNVLSIRTIGIWYLLLRNITEWRYDETWGTEFWYR
jgi:hypothetical protein